MSKDKVLASRNSEISNKVSNVLPQVLYEVAR